MTPIKHQKNQAQTLTPKILEPLKKQTPFAVTHESHERQNSVLALFPGLLLMVRELRRVAVLVVKYAVASLMSTGTIIEKVLASR